MPEPQQIKKQRKTSGKKKEEIANEANLRPKGVCDEKEQRPQVAAKEPKKRGRKIKYTTDEERKEARRQQNRNYRARRREELIRLRRQNAALKEFNE